MTIRMLQAWNGLPEQLVTTLSGSEEARLVGLGLAQYERPGGAAGDYDVLVYGATPSGCVAAVKVADLGKRVCLVDPEGRIGGMMGGGLSWTDIKTSVSRSSLGAGVVDELFRRVARYYGQSPQSFFSGEL